MRVLAYSDSRIYSGAEGVFCDVCAGLAQDGIETVVAIARGNWEMRRRISELPVKPAAVVEVPPQPLRLAGIRLWEPRRLWRIRRALRGMEWDAMVANLPSVEYGASPVLATSPRGRPAVGLLHVDTSPRTANFVLGSVREWCARPLLRRFHTLLAVSPAARDDLPATLGIDRDRLGTLPLPMPTVAYPDRQEARESLRLPHDRPVVVLIARLSIKQKGHDVLLAAAESVLSQRPEVVFALIGEGPDRPAIERLIADRGLGQQVRLLGPIRSGAWALAAADLMVIPSRFEGMPLVALEALQVGCPGVVSDVNGLTAIWPAAWRVPPDDPQALGERILALMETPPEVIESQLREALSTARAYTSDRPAAAVVSVLEAATQTG